MLNILFGGRPMARLPFKGIKFLKFFTHKSLNFEEYPYHCSYIFLHILVNFIVKNIF